MNIETFGPIGALFLLLFAAEGVLAMYGGRGTTTQLLSREIDNFIPFTWHGATWGSVYLWWVMDRIWYRYSEQWTWRQGLLALVLGTALTAGMLITWKKGDANDAYGQTDAFIPLTIQFGATATILLLFFLFTKDVPSDFTILVVVLMGLYVFLAMHILLPAFELPTFHRLPGKEPFTLGVLCIGWFGLVVGAFCQMHSWWGWW